MRLQCTVCTHAQSCVPLCDPTDCGPPDSSVYGDSSGKNTGVGCLALLQEIFPSQGSNPGLLHCGQIFFLPSELPAKPMNTGVGCHFLPQGSFPAQEWNPSLLESPALAGGFFTTEEPGRPILIEHLVRTVNETAETARKEWMAFI